MSRSERIRIHDEVTHAIQARRPVVALESAVITHGLPRGPASAFGGATIEGWMPAPDAPLNLELARAMQQNVRAAGAMPATIAILDGVLHVGLTNEQLQRLAHDEHARKASATNMSHVLAQGASAGTTVSCTLVACAHRDLPHPIHIMATGGIGGAHRGWAKSADISADLHQLAVTQVCVVCSGAKSILDVKATLEMLDSRGVPVVGYRTDVLPQFIAQADDDFNLGMRIDDPTHAARMCREHWHTLGSTGGIVLAQHAPRDHALEIDVATQAVLEAEEEAMHAVALGEALTPHLLQSIAAVTKGRSVIANVALLLENARLAAAVASAWSTLPEH